MDGNIPLDQYKKTDFLQSFNLTYKSNLNIRIFLDNSITNYLHQLAPNLSAEELVEMGNLQFSFLLITNSSIKTILTQAAILDTAAAKTPQQY